jgi:S-adenosylmethionine:tRNA-ribosyltransferase-isomerase (queuine synthetase)
MCKQEGAVIRYMVIAVSCKMIADWKLSTELASLSKKKNNNVYTTKEIGKHVIDVGVITKPKLLQIFNMNLSDNSYSPV